MAKEPVISNQESVDLSPPTKQSLPFEHFVRYLKTRGFETGVGDHLRLQAVLNSLEPNCPHDRLRMLLCPLFARSAEQQEQFNQIFDEYFIKQLPTLQEEKKASKGAKVVGYRSMGETSLAKEGVEKIKWKWWYTLIGGLLALAGGIAWLNRYATDKNRPPTDNELLSGRAQPTIGSFLTDAIPGYVVGIIGVILLLAILTFTIWYFWKKRKQHQDAVLNSERLRKPMLHWKLEIPSVDIPLFSKEQILKSTRLLKTRSQSETQVLDIPETIRQSVQGAGFPRLAYKHLTKPPEYLILIDRESFRDHQAIYFEELFRNFEEQEVFAKRYFYKKRPDNCWDDNDQGISLAGLYKKYPEHALIIMGEATHLVDPEEAKISPYVSLLSQWQYKVILTLRQPAQTVLDALNRDGDFPILKANAQNLLQLHEALLFGEQFGIKEQQTYAKLKTSLEHLSPEETIRKLKIKLDGLTYDWLSACAVYPELNWAFTLYLGEQLFGQKNFDESRLLALIQLPWYRSGLIPDKLRTALIQQMPEALLLRTRQVILDWMVDHPPQLSTEHKRKEFELFIAMEAALLDPKSKEKQAWLQNKSRDRGLDKSRYREIILRNLDADSKASGGFELPSVLRRLFGMKGATTEEKIYLYPAPPLSLRLGAWLIDGFWFLLLVIGVFYLEHVISDLLKDKKFLGNWSIVYDLFQFFIPILFSIPIVFWWIKDGLFGGRGIGKQAFGLLLINVKDRRRIGWYDLFLRRLDLLLISSFVVLFIWGMTLFDQSNNMVVQTINVSLGAIAVLLVLFLIDIVYLWRNPHRRVPLNRLSNTQVVFLKDFRLGNYEGNEQMEKPVDLVPEPEAQGEGSKGLPEIEQVAPIHQKAAERVFLTLTEIEELVKELSGQTANASLKIFQTRKQQTWLTFTSKEVFCLLDGNKTGSKTRRILQWRMSLEEANNYIHAKKNAGSKNSGLLDIGKRRNWYYSLKLHPEREMLEKRIYALIKQQQEQSSSFEEAAQTVESNVSFGESIAAITERGNIFILDAFNDVDLTLELVKDLRAELKDAEVDITRASALEALGRSDAFYKDEIDDADIVLCLLSPSFLADSAIHDLLEYTLKAHESQGLQILPVILKPCDWTQTNLGRFQAVPQSMKAIADFEDRLEAYREVANAVRSLLDIADDELDDLISSVANNPIEEKPVQSTIPAEEEGTPDSALFPLNKEKLQRLIAEGELKKALNVFREEVTENDTKIVLIQLMKRYNELEKKNMMELLLREEYTIELNKIRNSLLQFINDYDFEQLKVQKKKVFLSYGKRDLDDALKVRDFLEANRIEVLTDFERFLEGSETEERSIEMIRKSDATISLISRGVLTSPWSEKESGLAIGQFVGQTKVITCSLDSGFFEPNFANDCFQTIQSKIDELEAERDKRVELSSSWNTSVIDAEITAYKERLTNLPEEIRRLKESLIVDISGDNFERGLLRVIQSIHNERPI